MSKKKIDFPSRAARRDYLLKKELTGGGSVDIVTENTSFIELSGNGSEESPLKAEAVGLGEAATKNVGENAGNLMEVGAFGIGGRGRDLAIDEDIQQVPTGIYTMQVGHPQNKWDASMTLIVSRSGEFGTYIACHTSSNKVYYASGDESASLDWGELVFLSDVQRIVDESVDRALNQ